MTKRMQREYIQKILAHCGYGSRRNIEGWLRSGRIQVNGEVAQPGQRISARDKVSLDGIRLTLSIAKKIRILGLYKPEGVICTHRDPQKRKTVYQLLPNNPQRPWIGIGRLDINTAGLLLFTNDGDTAQRLMHPSMQIEREYAIRVLGKASPQQLKNLSQGVMLDGKVARFTDIVSSGGKGANQWYYAVLLEGRKREVRRLWETQGLQVSRLIRVRFGNYVLPRNKRPGQYWELDEAEKDQLATIIAER